MYIQSKHQSENPRLDSRPRIREESLRAKYQFILFQSRRNVMVIAKTKKKIFNTFVWNLSTLNYGNVFKLRSEVIHDT